MCKLRGSLVCLAYFLTCYTWVFVQPGTGRRPVDWCSNCVGTVNQTEMQFSIWFIPIGNIRPDWCWNRMLPLYTKPKCSFLYNVFVLLISDQTAAGIECWHCLLNWNAVCFLYDVFVLLISDQTAAGIECWHCIPNWNAVCFLYDVFVLLISDQTAAGIECWHCIPNWNAVFYIIYSYCYFQTRLVQESNVGTVSQTEMHKWFIRIVNFKPDWCMNCMFTVNQTEMQFSIWFIRIVNFRPDWCRNRMLALFTKLKCSFIYHLYVLLITDQPSFRRPFTHYQRDISGSANNGNVGGNANAGAGSVNVGNGISNCASIS